MKKLLAIIMAIALIFALCACGGTTTSQGEGAAEGTASSDTKLGNYSVEIKSCRLAEDYEGKPIVIITYGFTNNGKESASFSFAITDEVYQADIGLNKCYFADDSANYNSDNQTKDIKSGASLDVDVAYVLNDTSSDVVVEVSELISFNDKKLSKTFKIAK